jgi:capsule polysaccharide export protein KpsE/RkpR
VSPNNPQIPSLASRSELLREAIGRQEARVAGKQPGLVHDPVVGV